MRRHRVLLAGFLLLSAVAAGCAAVAPSEDVSVVHSALMAGDMLVISQVYGGGGNANAPYKADYVELFNRGTSDVSLAGASLQYSSAGTNTYGNVVPLPNATLAAGKHFLVRFATGANGDDLPIATDLTSTTNLSASDGKLVLSSGATSVTCAGACGGAATVIDFVGFGSANDAEGAAAPAGSNTKALFRKDQGCTDTDHNDADFATGAPGNLHNASSDATVCGEPVDAGPDADAGDDGGDAGDAGDAGDSGDAGDGGRPDASVDGGDAGDAGDARAPDDDGPTPRDAGKSSPIDDWVPQPAPAVGDGCAAASGRAPSALGVFAALASVLGLAARRRRKGAR